MIWEAYQISERLKKVGVGLKEAMAVIHMMLDDHPQINGPMPAGMFEGLHSLIDRTVKGARIERFKPQGGRSPFHTFEARTHEGQTLGHLNMVYLRKPLPCYYLVYVEVLAPFRGRGLGTRIIESFKLFVESRGCLGLLDNIIPPSDPTFHIYTKLGYRPVEELIGMQSILKDNHYMLWIPQALAGMDLKEKLIKLIFNLQRKRAVIEMKDNEEMVKRTIDEFRGVYLTLERMFESELDLKKEDPLMRFMFTKFVTKLMGFSRRISRLLGYTGGESLEQIKIRDDVLKLKAQTCCLWGPKEARVEILEPEAAEIPRAMGINLTAFVESLPLYNRPYLREAQKDGLVPPEENLRIRDLMELGFDPTRLREWNSPTGELILERAWPRFEASLSHRAAWLRELSRQLGFTSFDGARVLVNPPLFLASHLGNLYVCRRKIRGIHLEEALDQLRLAPHLVNINQMARIDRKLVSIAGSIKLWLEQRVPAWMKGEVEELAVFVPWDLERNFPEVMIEPGGVCVDRVWLA